MTVEIVFSSLLILTVKVQGRLMSSMSNLLLFNYLQLELSCMLSPFEEIKPKELECIGEDV